MHLAQKALSTQEVQHVPLEPKSTSKPSQGIPWFLKSIFQNLYTIDTVIHFDDNNGKISIKKIGDIS